MIYYYHAHIIITQKIIITRMIIKGGLDRKFSHLLAAVLVPEDPPIGFSCAAQLYLLCLNAMQICG